MLDHLEDLFVGESAVDLDGRPGESGDRSGCAVRVELHEGADGVPGVPRLEAGQAVGEDLRQHRDDEVGQVDAGPSPPGRVVERRAGPDEVRDVGDVDAEGPVALLVDGST